MTKNIVFFADGTWNGPGEDFEGNKIYVEPTNVLKLYHWLSGKENIESLKLIGEAEKNLLNNENASVTQVAKYINGVGYDANWLAKVLGGVFGSGIITRIVRGYTYLSRNYEKDDKIYIIGFSRGAYTARALAGLILSQGLLDGTKTDLNDKEQAYRLGCAIWYKHRANVLKTNTTLFAKLQNAVLDLPRFFTADKYIHTVNIAEIEAIGVWETVGSLGIPLFVTDKDERIDVFNFADNVLNEKVNYGFQALSLDERRVDFTPTLWESRDNITQTIFPGAHADVGGGYPIGKESGLSDGALLWMQEKMSARGLVFDTKPLFINPDPMGIAHQPWIYSPYNKDFVRKGARIFKKSIKLLVDESVTLRRQGGYVFSDPSMTSPGPYNPVNAGF